ncbi:ArsR/SmtB family transcription factor [Halovivax gelatinilyticus]|uniref:ArsR/SmtB family transcription factor n=1 Tax=Halovivax gelatinilyticus TaxID=2961597 RepID=UPI0020CA79C0|nr:helix-turn-helix domain-containing protein [Halovivax gelatinilyticus]
MGESESTRRLTHESFAAVGNELRMDILRTLWFHGPLSFSDLYDRVDVDDSGQFTYHLSTLRDQFVRKSDDEYSVTVVGSQLVMTVLAAVETDDSEKSPYDLDAACHGCESNLQAVDGSGWLEIDCPSCEKLYASYPVPPAGSNEWSSAERLWVFDQRIRRTNALVHRGICPNCSCRMDRTIVHDAEPPPGLPFVFEHRCGHCRLESFTLPGTGLLEHPAMVAFYHDRDEDLFYIPQWEIPWLYDGRVVDVVSEDPFTYAIEVHVEDDQFRATLDEEGCVCRVDVVVA